MDPCGARGEAALEDGEGEADGVAPLAVEPVRAAHALADIVGDLLIELGFVRGELVGDGVREALREERLALEGEQVLLDHAAHDALGVGVVVLLAIFAGELVAVEEGEEGLEVLLLARVRGRGHEEEVTGPCAEELAELEALGLLEFAAEPVGAHPVGFVDDDQVPVAVLDLLEQGLVAGEVVHPGDEERVGIEDGLADGGVDELVGQDVEAQAELEEELVLPLVDEATRGDDEATVDVVAQDQLLDVEASHDRLAGTGVVGEEEAERSLGEQLAIDGADLVREGSDVTRGDSEHRVVEASELDALGLGGQFELVRIGVEGSPVAGPEGQGRLVPAIDHALGQSALSGLVVDRACGGTVHDRVDDRHLGAGHETGD